MLQSSVGSVLIFLGCADALASGADHALSAALYITAQHTVQLQHWDVVCPEQASISCSPSCADSSPAAAAISSVHACSYVMLVREEGINTLMYLSQYC